MGWMFVPLVQYQGGGDAATLEPLRDHLAAYGAHLAQNFASGVQACYRGPRLYDSEETKALVKHWVDFYRRYRAILDSDIVHVRRPDGRDLDIILHVNPRLPEKGLAVVYNPLDQEVPKRSRYRCTTRAWPTRRSFRSRTEKRSASRWIAPTASKCRLPYRPTV